MSLKRALSFAYGVGCYLVFLVTVLYAVGFIGDFVVPKTIDSPPEGSLAQAIVVNMGLFILFALQHSVMARPAFKRWWCRFIPQHLERSTYVLFSSVALIVMFWLWQPMGGVVWNIQASAGRAAMYVLFALGCLIVLVATFLIDHFDLFGLRQVWLHLRGREYTPLAFKTPWAYRVVRHPLYLGWILASWMTPTMTFAHLYFAVGVTGYILIAIRFEERDLSRFHPEYGDYRKRVPMLIPRLTRSSEHPPVPEEAESTLAR